MRPLFGSRRTAPNSARLTASVPEATKVTSVRRRPSAVAATSRAWSSAARAARPSEWGLDGLPSGTLRSASRTSGRTGAEPASSRYMRLNAEPVSRSAAAGIRLLDQLCESALEALEIEMKIEDLVDADGFHLHHRRARRLCGGVLDLLNRAAGD